MADPVKASDVAAEPRVGWASRIVGQGAEAPEDLLANPRNWRIHPGYQQRAMEQALDEVGWVQQIIVNQVTGHVIDGHMRVGLAISRGEPSVPVMYVNLSVEEEAVVLATLDPLGGLAGVDDGALKGLLSDIEGRVQSDLGDMLASLGRATGSVASPNPTQDDLDMQERRLKDQFAGPRQDMLDVTCPHCAESFAINLDEIKS